MAENNNTDTTGKGGNDTKGGKGDGKSGNGPSAMGIASGIMGAASAALSAFNQASQLNGNYNQVADSANMAASNMNDVSSNSNDDFVNSSYNSGPLAYTTVANTYGRSTGQDLLNNLQSGLQGGMAGASAGPWGMFAGAAAAQLGNIAGNMAAKKKAKQLTASANGVIYDLNNQRLQQLDNAAQTSSMRTLDNMMGGVRFAALGGPINMQYTGTNSPFGNRFANGGIHIKKENQGKFTALANNHNMTPLQLANHIFANKGDYSSTQIKRANFVRNASNWHANGGNLDNQFSDFRNGVTEYNTGGTHEENPYEGVQVGVDQQGTPNLVEEGEVNYNDYIFSNRLKVPKDFKKQYKLGTSKKKLTYADAAKKLQKESEERPLDPISKAGLEASLGALANSQEEERSKEQMKDPQFRQQAMQAMAQQQAQQQGVPEEEQDLGGPEDIPQEEQQQQPSEEELAAMQQQGQPYAYGGRKSNKFDYGGLPDLDPKASEEKIKYGMYVNDPTDFKANGWNMYQHDFFNKLNGVASIKSQSTNPEMWYWDDMPEASDYTKSKKEGGIPFLENYGDASGYYASAPVRSLYENMLLHNPTEFTKWANRMGVTEDYARKNFRTIRDGRPGPGSWTPSLRVFPSLETPLQKNVDIRNPHNYVENSYIDFKQEKLPTTNTTTTPPSDIPAIKGLPTWLRYAPIATAAVGLFSKPNYTEADRLQAAVNNSSKPNLVSGHYIGDYLKYTPYDINYNANQIRQQGNTQLRNIANMSGGNRAAAMANMAAANYTTQNAISAALRQAQEYNDNLRTNVEKFNRETNQYNANIANQVAQFNAQQRAAAKSQYLSGMIQAANMREKQQLLADQARSNAISSIGNSLGDIGRENFAANQQLGLIFSGYYGAIDPAIMPLILKNNGINPNSKTGKALMNSYKEQYQKLLQQDAAIKEAQRQKEEAQKKAKTQQKGS